MTPAARPWQIAEAPSGEWPAACDCPDRVAVRVVVDGVVTYAADLPAHDRSAILTRLLVARSARQATAAVYAGLGRPEATAVIHYLTCPSCGWHFAPFRANRRPI